MPRRSQWTEWKNPLLKSPGAFLDDFKAKNPNASKGQMEDALFAALKEEFQSELTEDNV